MIENARFVVDDPSPVEKQFRTMGKETTGRHVFVIFSFREKDGKTLLRPISARYMHEKEIRSYEAQMASSRL